MALTKDRFEKGTSDIYIYRIYTGESEKREEKYRDGGGEGVRGRGKPHSLGMVHTAKSGL